MSKTAFDLRKIQGVIFDVDGVLSPSTIPMGDDGAPQRMVNIKDGYAMQLAVKRGLHIAIITGADTPAIARRYAMLGIKDVYIKAADKGPVMDKWLAENGLNEKNVAYVGDDIPDLQCMRRVGLAVAPADAAVEIKDAAQYITQSTGGYGVGRELLEQILKAKGLWMSHADAFGW